MWLWNTRDSGISAPGPKPGDASKLQKQPARPPGFTRREAETRYGFDQEYPFLFSISEVVNCLWDLIQDTGDAKSGLIFVTGPTNSSKSKVARGLVWKHINSRFRKRCHLVTYEDPIEELAFGDEWKPSEVLGDSLPCFDYTPRQKPIDYFVISFRFVSWSRMPESRAGGELMAQVSGGNL